MKGEGQAGEGWAPIAFGARPSAASTLPAGERLRVGLVSLGCPKNLVDSEVMLGRLQARGHALVPDAHGLAARIVIRLRPVLPARARGAGLAEVAIERIEQRVQAQRFATLGQEIPELASSRRVVREVDFAERSTSDAEKSDRPSVNREGDRTAWLGM